MPTGKGFDSFLGYLNGNEDYVSHYMGGHVDFHEKGSTGRSSNRSSGSSGSGSNCTAAFAGRYSTEVYAERAQQLLVRRADPSVAPLFLYLAWQAVHEPLEAPARYLAPYSDISSPLYIEDQSRRVYAGMLAALDDALANISKTLEEHRLWRSTILVLSSDNGGMSGTYGMACCKCGTSCGGLNYPFRGYKDSNWEGGLRAIGLIYAPAFLARPGRSYTPLVWVGDWFRTLTFGAALASDGPAAAAAARRRLDPLLRSGPIDSVDQVCRYSPALMPDPMPARVPFRPHTLRMRF